jgi:diguanylate cyclase (GGDEF)-like protein
MLALPKPINMTEDVRLAFIMERTLLASSICHFLFIPLFLWLGVQEMVVLNIFSTIALLLSIYLTRRRIFRPAFVIGTSEIIIHAVLAVHFIGWGSGFHYFLIVLTPFIFFWPYWTSKTKILVSLCLFLLYASLFTYARSTIPVHSIADWQVYLTTMVTAFTAFAVFASVALYYQTSVNQVENNLREANRLLENLARTDPLTALHNRRIIEEKLGDSNIGMMDDGKAFSVIMSDIDHFKKLNDTFGHQIGDLVLISVSKILKNATRSGDVVARWGGEEFLILLPGTCGREAEEVAERMRIAIAQSPIYIDDNEICISMTFGVAECTFEIGINECINRADKALYEGKNSGRNKVVLLNDNESVN